jgi:hypothetical protein
MPSYFAMTLQGFRRVNGSSTVKAHRYSRPHRQSHDHVDLAIVVRT